MMNAVATWDRRRASKIPFGADGKRMVLVVDGPCVVCGSTCPAKNPAMWLGVGKGVRHIAGTCVK